MPNNKTKKAKHTTKKAKHTTKKANKTKKDRKWTDPTYPYRNISKQEAIDEFLRLRRLAETDINPRSHIGNRTVDWGTERMRRKTKYRKYSHDELWKNKKKRDKLLQFAKRIHRDYNYSKLRSLRNAIDLQWGTVNTMRPASAIQMYKKYKATSVLDFTAGWGARMIAAMALDID